MQKFVPFFQLVLASWIARLLGYCGVVLGTVGVTLTYKTDAPAAIAQVFIGLILAGAHALISHLTLKTAHNSSPTPPLPNGVSRALVIFAALAGACFSQVGCTPAAIPAQFDSPPAAAPLSATDTTIVQQLANFDTPTSLATIETSVSTLTSIGMYVGIKQTSTMQTDGVLLYGAGLALQAPKGGAIPSSTAVGDVVGGLKLSAADQQSAANFATLAQALNGVTGLINTQIAKLASQSSTPSVAAYAAQVGEDVLAAAGKGICDATAQYATGATAAVPALTFDLHPVARDEQGLVVYSF